MAEMELHFVVIVRGENLPIPTKRIENALETAVDRELEKLAIDGQAVAFSTRRAFRQ